MVLKIGTKQIGNPPAKRLYPTISLGFDDVYTCNLVVASFLVGGSTYLYLGL